jgi:DNA-binding NarL/FixJ family response regulator
VNESARTLLLADSATATRVGVRGVLEAAGFVVAAEAGDAEAAVAAAVRSRPDVALVAVDLPGGGIAAAADIAARVPTARIVMLADNHSDDELLQALRAGASGYLLKETNPERLPHALRGVVAGEAAIPRALVGRLVEEFRDRGRRRGVVPGRPDARLTTREWEVLELLHDGLDTDAIASRLGISEVTVRRHASTLVRKLGVSGRAAAVRLLDAGE